MDKPIIFFSHSSQDRDALLPIREQLVEGTGSAIEVFMSSDGASIPFGRNWLKEIEEALGECRLMFVWMTPSSLNSNWIPFESGYAYSKGIKVVPIGYDGIRLENLPAPLSMLQGFNVTSAASLNNIVAIINQEFELTFPELFDDNFYRQHVEDATSESSPELLRFVRVIRCDFWDNINLDDGETVKIVPASRDILRKVLTENTASFSEVDGQIIGMGFRVHDQPVNIIQISIDPLALNTTWQYWAESCKRLYNEKSLNVVLTVGLIPEINLPEDLALIGSRLLNSEVSFDTVYPHVLYRFRNVQFRIDRGLVLIVSKDNTDPIPLLSLLKLLEERQILLRDN